MFKPDSCKVDWHKEIWFLRCSCSCRNTIHAWYLGLEMEKQTTDDLSNSNWWSTFPRIIRQVILIESITNVEIKICFVNFFWAKKWVVLFISFDKMWEILRSHYNECNRGVTGEGFQSTLSNLKWIKVAISDTCARRPMWS